MLPVLHPVQLFYPTFGTLMGVSPFVAYVNPFDSQYPLMSSQPLGRQMTPWGTVPSCPANTYPIVRTLPTTPPPGTAGLVEKKELGQFPVNRPAGDLRKQQQQQAVGPANASNVEKAAISASRRASHHVFGTEGGNNSSTAPDCQPRAVQSNQQQYSGGFKNHPRVFGPDPRSFPVWKEHYWVTKSEMDYVASAIRSAAANTRSLTYIFPSIVVCDNDPIAKFETGLKTLGPFISGQCSSVARIKGFRYLYDRAQEVSQYTRPFVLAILPILYKQHWRIASIDTRRNYFVALLDPQLVTERVELQRPLTTMLSLFREITRLLHLDTAEPPGSRVTPNTNFKLARGQLENIYLGLQTDRWSCGFWCFTLMIFLMRQPNVPPSEIKRHLTAVATNIPAAFYHWMKSKRREAALNSLVHKLCSSPGAT